MTVTMRSGQRVSESCSCSAFARPRVMMHHHHTPATLSALSPTSFAHSPPRPIRPSHPPSATTATARAAGAKGGRTPSTLIREMYTTQGRQATRASERPGRPRKEGSKEGPPYIGLVRHVRSDSKDEPQRDSLSSRHETGRRAAAAIFAIFC